jgi:hypothetical protein
MTVCVISCILFNVFLRLVNPFCLRYFEQGEYMKDYSADNACNHVDWAEVTIIYEWNELWHGIDLYFVPSTLKPFC